MQSPAQPVGSLSSSMRRHVGRKSSEKATHASDGAQESQNRTIGQTERGSVKGILTYYYVYTVGRPVIRKVLKTRIWVVPPACLGIR